MEQDRFALLGAPVFARGHLRNYAALVGAPEREIMADCDVGEVPEPSFLPALDLKPKTRDHARWAWPITAVLLAVAGVAIYWWLTART
jgi:cytoskeletal protein RodZ